MDRRKSDWRIYIVTALFISCVVSGGVLLGLYLLLPNPKPLFLQAGMILVGFPWLFWLLGYLYTCVIKPCKNQIPREQQDKSATNVDPEKGKNSTTTTMSENATSVAGTMGDNSAADGERHVQFGNVTVIEGVDGISQDQRQEHAGEGEENGVLILRGGDGDHVSDDDDDRDEKGSDFSGDCDKTPLRLSFNNASYSH